MSLQRGSARFVVAAVAASSCGAVDASEPPRSGGVPIEDRLVDMIPERYSGESNQDSEAFLAVHPSDPDILVGSAFTESMHGQVLPCGSMAPLYFSLDGGLHWFLVDVIPDATRTLDTTLTFHPPGSSSNELRAAILRWADSMQMRSRMFVLRLDVSSDVPTLVDSFRRMSVMNGCECADQPFIYVLDAGRTFVAYNDSANGFEPSIDRFPVEPDYGWSTERVDPGGSDGRVTPTGVRMAAAGNVAFAAFFRRVPLPQSGNEDVEVRVKRDDDLTDAYFFDNLGGRPGDPSDSRRVTTIAQPTGELGFQRLNPSLSIAVTPGKAPAATDVWIAFTQAGTQGEPDTAVWRGTQSGEGTWDEVARFTDAVNASLAVADDGTVGILYQQLTTAQGTGSRHWKTILLQGLERPVTGQFSIELASNDPTIPQRGAEPYLGDYSCLVVRKDASNREWFHGAFCASNFGDFANFATWQRHRDPQTKQMSDRDGNAVQPSIDPFYFRIAVRLAPQS
jgi:hypothetical protein